MSQQKNPAFAPDVRVADRRTKSKRHQRIAPTPCEHPCADEDAEVIEAMDQYKRDNLRRFPTWSEVLEVMHALGYRRVAEPTKIPRLSPSKRPKVKA